MKKTALFLYAIILSLSSCATAHAAWGDDLQSVNSVKHWKSDERIVYVKGEVIEVIDSETFRLRDDTGEIKVHLDHKALREFTFHPGMHLEVRGRVEREHHRFDLEATAVKLHDGAIIGDY